jgi:hypothetical protein
MAGALIRDVPHSLGGSARRGVQAAVRKRRNHDEDLGKFEVRLEADNVERYREFVAVFRSWSFICLSENP